MEVGQMVTITKAMQWKQQYMSQDQMNFMRVSHMRNFSTCKDLMKLVNPKEKPVGKEHISAILARESTAHRSMPNIHHRSTSVRNHHPLRFHWEEKDEYGVYRDDHGHARDVDGHIISVAKEDIRSLLERASGDEHSYIFLPDHASSLTQTKLVPEIYTKEKINEMFYGVCGAQEKNEDDFQMKLDGVYYPLNDSISWLTTCMEEMRQDIAKIQT
ncbi:hypothetical protein F2Q69_00022594 [Brassica cretica]|uniref:Uncharacterized protein n=1 Tax=Brassica cretica TaxID=69181 RepID=A0A8S9QIJ8_BRACR|nr:hypothetical protein F2Q69_00022594 [Brassica cretica]